MLPNLNTAWSLAAAGLVEANALTFGANVVSVVLRSD